MKVERLFILAGILIIIVSLFCIISLPPHEEAPRPVHGKLKLTNYDNSTDSATFKVEIKWPDNVKLYNSTGQFQHEVYIYDSKAQKTYSDMRWEYMDIQDDDVITTGDKLILYNASKYTIHPEYSEIRISLKGYNGFIGGDLEDIVNDEE